MKLEQQVFDEDFVDALCANEETVELAV